MDVIFREATENDYDGIKDLSNSGEASSDELVMQN